MDSVSEAIQAYLGLALARFWEDPEVSEIYVNSDLWVRTLGSSGRRRHNVRLERPAVEGFLTALAASSGRRLDAEEAQQDFELPATFGSARLHATVPPATDGPTFTLRKHPTTLYLLPDLVTQRVLSEATADYLRERVQSLARILITGATYAGKTGLLNALLHELVVSRPSDRYVILEEGTAEVKCNADDVLILRTTPHLSLWDLVRGTLRRTPDHVIVGEIRGQEAYPFLDAMTTGHGSTLSTLHAGSPRAGLHRLDRLARRAFPSSDPPDQGPLIAEAIDLVVTIRAGHEGRRVTALAEVHGYSSDKGFDLVHPPATAGIPGE